MGFSAVGWLLLGALAALPIVAHLIRNRDLPIIELPTARFLLQAQKRARHKKTLKDRILLGLRILVVVAVSLAAAGPFTQEILAYGDGTPESLRLVIDDSMSMSAPQGDLTALDQARERALEIVRALEQGSEVAVILAGDPARVALPPTEDLSAVEDYLESGPPPSGRATALSDAVRRARALGGKPNLSVQTVVLTDHTRVAADSLGTLSDGLRRAIRLERFGPERPGTNFSVEQVLHTNDPTRPGEWSLRISIAGTGGEEDSSSASVLRITEGDQTVREQAVTLTGRRTEVTTHVPIPDPSVGLLVKLETDPPDALLVDNERQIRATRSGALRIALVHDVSQGAARELRFVRAALNALEGHGAGREVTVMDQDTLARRLSSPDGLADVDVVVLANPRGLQPDAATKIRSYVEAGGGLLLTGGVAVEPRVLDRNFQGLFGVQIGRAVASASLIQVNEESSWLGDTSLSAQVERHLNLTLLDAEVHLQVDASPILVSTTHGEGRVALLATSIDTSWTDLPLSTGFLPMVMHVMEGLSPRIRRGPHVITSGDPMELASGRELTILDPNGESYPLPDGGTFTDTGPIGHYRVLDSDGEPRDGFVTRPSASEADLSFGAASPTGPEPATPTGGMERSRDWAPWFFLLFGLWAVLEAAFRLHWRRPRRQASFGTRSTP